VDDQEVVARLTSKRFLSEIHAALWEEPFMNRGLPDPGWSCRDHALLTAGILGIEGIQSRFIYGRTMFLRGFRGIGQELTAESDHRWLEADSLGLVDLSPQVRRPRGGSPATWPGVDFEALIGEWLPVGSGTHEVCFSGEEYARKVAEWSHRPDESVALYYQERVSGLSPQHISSPNEVIDSPLGVWLERFNDPELYAKAILHFSDRFNDRGASAGIANKAVLWRNIASRSAGAVDQVLGLLFP
jgi:hypothetical protein